MRSLFLRVPAILAPCCVDVSLLAAQTATAPTEAEDPAKIERAWQKASTKYDSARATLLNQVGVQGFRPDVQGGAFRSGGLGGVIQKSRTRPWRRQDDAQLRMKASAEATAEQLLDAHDACYVALQSGWFVRPLRAIYV